MKKLLTVLLLVVFVAGVAPAQKYKYKNKNASWKKDRHHLFLSIGISNFLGELGGANRIGSKEFSLRDFDFPSVRPSFNVGYYFVFARNFALRSAFSYSYISGNDKYTEEPFRNNRNLNFRTPVYELSTAVEFFYEISKRGARYSFKGLKGAKSFSATPYIYTGIGAFYFNPKGKLDGKWYTLRNLSTEGQGLVPTRKVYSNYQVVIPIGLGIKFAISRSLQIGIEYAARITFTDYMDDVSTTYFDDKALLAGKGQLAVDLANPSPTKFYDDTHEYNWRNTAPGQQRGNPKNDDSYMNVFITLYYSINQGFVPKLRF